VSIYYKCANILKGHTLSSKPCIEDGSKGFEKPPGGIPDVHWMILQVLRFSSHLQMRFAIAETMPDGIVV
jgi:hypothetical protein